MNMTELSVIQDHSAYESLSIHDETQEHGVKSEGKTKTASFETKLAASS